MTDDVSAMVKIVEEGLAERAIPDYDPIPGPNPNEALAGLVAEITRLEKLLTECMELHVISRRLLGKAVGELQNYDGS